MRLSRDDKAMILVAFGILLSVSAVVEAIYLGLNVLDHLVMRQPMAWLMAVHGLPYSLGAGLLASAAAWIVWRRHYAH
jgi:hypothetical protein